MARTITHKPFAVALFDLYGWRPKVDETIADVRAGRCSYQGAAPVLVSRLGSGRASRYFVMDGYHRVVEALGRRDRSLEAIVSEHVPYIERTGGAYRSYLEDKVNIRRHIARGGR